MSGNELVVYQICSKQLKSFGGQPASDFAVSAFKRAVIVDLFMAWQKGRLELSRAPKVEDVEIVPGDREVTIHVRNCLDVISNIAV